MYSGSVSKSNSLLKVMFSEAEKCKFKIEETKKAEEQRSKLEQSIRIGRSNLSYVDETTAYLKGIRKKIVSYNDKKRERSMSAIYSAIYSAKNIIPDTSHVELKVDKGAAMLINDRGDLVNLIEGSAFRATLSFFIRSVILRNTEYIPFMLLDEPLTTLSEESSAALSTYLPILAQDMLIILIEQKESIFSNSTGDTTYLFQKAEGRTRARRVDK